MQKRTNAEIVEIARINKAKAELTHDGKAVVVTVETQQDRDDLLDWFDSLGFSVVATKWNRLVVSCKTP